MLALTVLALYWPSPPDLGDRLHPDYYFPSGVSKCRVTCISQDLPVSERGSLTSMCFWVPTTFPCSHAGRTGIFRAWSLGTSQRRTLGRPRQSVCSRLAGYKTIQEMQADGRQGVQGPRQHTWASLRSLSSVITTGSHWPSPLNLHLLQPVKLPRSLHLSTLPPQPPFPGRYGIIVIFKSKGPFTVFLYFSAHMSFCQRMKDFHSWGSVCMQESELSWVP